MKNRAPSRQPARVTFACQASTPHVLEDPSIEALLLEPDLLLSIDERMSRRAAVRVRLGVGKPQTARPALSPRELAAVRLLSDGAKHRVTELFAADGPAATPAAYHSFGLLRRKIDTRREEAGWLLTETKKMPDGDHEVWLRLPPGRVVIVERVAAGPASSRHARPTAQRETLVDATAGLYQSGPGVVVVRVRLQGAPYFADDVILHLLDRDVSAADPGIGRLHYLDFRNWYEPDDGLELKKGERATRWHHVAFDIEGTLRLPRDKRRLRASVTVADLEGARLEWADLELVCDDDIGYPPTARDISSGHRMDSSAVHKKS